MSYFERSIDYYFRRILFGGLDVLSKPKFRYYALSALLFIIVNSTLTLFVSFEILISESVIDRLLYIELAFSLALLITSLFIALTSEKNSSFLCFGVFLAFSLVLLLIRPFSVLSNVSRVFFYSWTFLLAIAFFSMVNSFMTSNSTQVLVKFGKREKHVFLFKYLLVIYLIGLGIHILTIYEEIQQNIVFEFFGIISLIVWIICFIHLTVLPKRGVNDAYCSSVSLFYLVSFYHVIIYFMKLQSKKLGVAQGIIVFDVIFIIVGTLYTIQAVSKRLVIKEKEKSKLDSVANIVAKETESRFQTSLKKISDKAAILFILSLAVGYNVFALTVSLGQSSWIVAYLFHQVSLLAVFILLVLIIVVYLRSDIIRGHYENTPGTKEAFASFLRFLGKDKAQEIIKKMLSLSKDTITTKTQDALTKGVKGLKDGIKNMFSR